MQPLRTVQEIMNLAKRRINGATLYLAQWEGYESLNLGAAEHFAPQIICNFELQYITSI